jgi:ribonuclease P protein component
MLRKENRLRNSPRIQEIRSSGQSWHNRWLVLTRLASSGPQSHFAISVSRRVGTAVTRNRVRRLIGESIRLRLPCIARGWDILVIARLPAREAPFAQIDCAVADLLRRSQLQGCSTLPELCEDREARLDPGAARSTEQKRDSCSPGPVGLSESPVARAGPPGVLLSPGRGASRTGQ